MFFPSQQYCAFKCNSLLGTMNSVVCFLSQFWANFLQEKLALSSMTPMKFNE